MSLFEKDMFRLETPGGGGYGIYEGEEKNLITDKKSECKNASLFKTGSLSQFSAIQESA
jgi:hypothetical protein